MKLLKPVLTCIKEAKVMLFTCLLRYLHDPCCVDPGHMVDKDKSNQAADLTLLKKAVRSFIFAEKLKGVRVVDPTMLCITTKKSCWEDLVQLNKEQFAKLADGLAGMIAGVEEPAAEGEGGADKPDAKRIRLLSSTVPYGAIVAAPRGGGAAAAGDLGGAAADDCMVGEGGGRVSRNFLSFFNPHHTYPNDGKCLI